MRGDANIAAADEARINDRIRAREVLLIAADGEQLGVRPLPQALAIAREQELDLVEVAPNANPPVCRIMDYRRWQYEQQQRRKESRKKATNVVIKEMKFRPKIDGHDYTTKMKHVQRFLGEGNKVKLTIMFRGREMAHPELGLKILNKIAEDVAEMAIVESSPRQDGRNMTMVLHPTKKPKTPTKKTPTAVRTEARTRSPPPPREPERDAEGQDAPGRREALQGHRYRQDPAAQGVPFAPAREEVEPAHPSPRPWRRGHRRRQEARRAHVGSGLTDGFDHRSAHGSFQEREKAMARVKRAVQGKKHRRAILEKAEGYSGSRSRHFRKANEQVMHSGNYAFRDRRRARATSASCGSSGSTPRAAKRASATRASSPG